MMGRGSSWFWLLLAWTWGTDVADARRRCSHLEYLAWRAFYRANPWGPYVDDHRSARLAHLVATSVERRGEKLSPESYLYGKPEVAERVQSPTAARAIMMNLVAQGLAKREPKG